MDQLYRQAIQEEIGDIVSSTLDIRSAVYTGEHALRLFLCSIHIDEEGYMLRMDIQSRDEAILVLKSIGPFVPNNGWKKASSLGKELSLLGISYMTQYVSKQKNTYRLCVRNISYDSIIPIIRVLFSF